MKIAVITGASSGIGKEFVKQLTENESFDEVWVIARREDRLFKLKEEMGDFIKPLSLDLQSREDIDRYKKLLEENSPEVAVLVNASGYGKFEAFSDLSLDSQLGMLDLNAKALTAVTYITLPYLKRGSRVYQMGSLSSFQPVPYIAVYGATKAYVLSFTRAVNAELRNTGIKMMAVCPGWVRTEFFDRAVVDDDIITYYNKFFTPREVVKKALRDMKKGKDVSVVGLSIRMQVLATKLLPHKLVMKVWLKQQQKK